MLLWMFTFLILPCSTSIFPLQFTKIHIFLRFSKISCPSPRNTLLAFILSTSVMLSGTAKVLSRIQSSFFSDYKAMYHLSARLIRYDWLFAVGCSIFLGLGKRKRG